MEIPDRIQHRIADLESEMIALRRELRSRQRNDRTSRPMPIWWVRTQGETTGGYYSETDYPEQDPDNPICELPAVYLNCEVPDPNTDPVVWTPRSETPQVTLVSPGGWIPEGIRLGVFRHHDDRMHVLRVPELRVVAVDTIAPDQHGTVTLWLAGEETDIEFEAWNDWLHGGTAIEAGKQCRAILDEEERHWSLSAGVEC
jgi:hypothetical protein